MAADFICHASHHIQDYVALRSVTSSSQSFRPIPSCRVSFFRSHIAQQLIHGSYRYNSMCNYRYDYYSQCHHAKLVLTDPCERARGDTAATVNEGRSYAEATANINRSHPSPASASMSSKTRSPIKSSGYNSSLLIEGLTSLYGESIISRPPPSRPDLSDTTRLNSSDHMKPDPASCHTFNEVDDSRTRSVTAAMEEEA